MIQLPGEAELELQRMPRLVLRAEIGPYDRRDPAVGGDRPPVRLYRDVPGIEHSMIDPADPELIDDREVYVGADLSGRMLGLGAIAHRINLHLNSSEASELSVEVDNIDNLFSHVCLGAPRAGLPHWLLRNNWHLGRILRVRGGVRDADGLFHYFPLYEGIIEGATQGERRITLSAYDPLRAFSGIIIEDNPTYTDETAAAIVEDLINTYTGEPGATPQTYARPLIDYQSFDDAAAASPFLLRITGSGASTLQGMNLAEAIALVALHGLGVVWIDGRRHVRFTIKETRTQYATFRLDADRNLLDARLSLGLEYMRNKVTVSYGASETEFTVTNDASILRYYEQAASFNLPFAHTEANAEIWAYRFLTDFGWPPLTLEAVADLTALGLECGDWAQVFHAGLGIEDLRFQAFSTDLDPGQKTVRIVCHNTDPSLREGGTFIWGVSAIDSMDRFI